MYKESKKLKKACEKDHS